MVLAVDSNFSFRLVVAQIKQKGFQEEPKLQNLQHTHTRY